MTFRAPLFVPGSRPDRFDKALASSADAIIIDLEDAVAPNSKAKARADTLSWLSQAGRQKRIGVRINSVRTAEGCADIVDFARTDIRPDFIMIPKVQSAIDLEIHSQALSSNDLLAIIECGTGVANAHQISQRSSFGVLFGGVDYSASVGADLQDWDALLYARGAIAAACGAASIPCYDAPYVDASDLDGLARTSLQSRKLGFFGRACIHPKQTEAVKSTFAPTPEERALAAKIAKAAHTANGGVVLVDGKMVDKPVLIAAQRLLQTQS